MISLENIRVTFFSQTPIEKKALRGMTLSLKKGEFTTLVGSNGAGKSTLMSVIAGELLPDQGSIRIQEKDVTRYNANQRSIWISRVFQDPLAGSCGDLTIAENLALAKKRGSRFGLQPALSKDTHEELRAALADLNLNLETRMDTPMKLLSGGQRQAVSLLMATLSPLSILLLDEHTAALDPKTAESIMELTEKIIREKNLTAIMVTHSLQHALQYGTRTVMLHEGRILSDLNNETRRTMTVKDLLDQFGKTLDNDRLLLGAN
jgi:putative ABC transport system ATP-binding protein